MKRVLIFSLFLYAFLTGTAQIQHSWDGKGINPHSELHCLNIFVNVIYDVHPDTNNQFNTFNYWTTVTDTLLEGVNIAPTLPTYLLDWMDTVYVPNNLHGTCTRLYGESSFDSLQITGDFVVVNIRESTVLNSMGVFDQYSIPDAVYRFLKTHPYSTLYHHNLIEYYDANHNGKIDYTNVLIRNITKQYGGLGAGSGYGTTGKKITIGGMEYDMEQCTVQCVGNGDFYANPTNIVSHEISHSLFGYNNFHTSGGNHRKPNSGKMVFLNIQGGYGLMGAAGSGLVGCNGYERWRMHWKHPQSVDNIAARNANNTQSVVSDISMSDGPQSFLLRDFVTYGDAVRIKLPYKDSSSSSNQYIWLENHQVGMNDKQDFLQYSNTHPCRPQGTPGIYAYYQVGRDILTSDQGEVWDTYHRDNLKIIPAEGYYDYEKEPYTHNLHCVSYEEHPYVMRRGVANPFCGGQDQEKHLFPDENDTILRVTHEYSMWRKVIGNDSIDSLPSIGDNRDAFITHTIINMGTNPSTCNTRTFHSDNTSYTSPIYAYNSELNTRKTYLSGLEIEMIPQNGNFLVNIRWNGYNISQDTRWTGDIVLKDTTVLDAGKTITLAQNRTVAQNTRDRQTGLFDKRTLFTCEDGSYFRQAPGSQMRLTEGSSLVLDSGSTYVLQSGADMLVQAGCSLVVRRGADLRVMGDAILTVDSCGTVILSDTARFGTSARIIVRPGGKLIVDGGTLTSACAGEMWQGICVEGHTNLPQTAANQGTVQLLNGATIENALCGILTCNPADSIHTTGGIVTADSATFRNCAKAVEYLSYADTNYAGQVVDNMGSFTNCTFTVDDNNLYASNGTDFLAHVTLWDVKGVKFTHCRFEDARTGTHTRKSAIGAIDAGFTMKTGCRYSVPRPECDCPPASSTHSSFEGFGTAIDAGTSGSPYGITIDGAQFSDNVTCVKIKGNSHATVTRNLFDLSVVPPGSKVTPLTGLSLDSCTGYQVEENVFTRASNAQTATRYGIKVGNSGPDANGLYRNTFERLNYGIYATGTNRNVNSNTGLQMTCNGFTNDTYGIYVASGATVGSLQGSSVKGADNTFSGTQTSSLYNAGSLGINYYYSTGTNHALQNPVGNVTLHANAGSNDCASTLCVLDPSIPGPGPKSPTPSFLALKQQYENMADTVETQNFASLQQMNAIAVELFAQSHEAVRALMADTLEDLQAVMAWLDATPGLASRYLAVETGFAVEPVMGTNAVETHGRASLQDVATHLTTSAERDEYDNYVAFHALKQALEDGGHVMWPNATDAQIGDLVRIADANTGRSSLLAKNVLCFFFGICYDDMEMRALETTTIPPLCGGTPITGQQNITVHPNPANDILNVTVTGGDAKIARVEMFDMFGRPVSAETHGRASLPSPQTAVNTSGIPSGLYILRVTLTDGTVRNVKVVKE